MAIDFALYDARNYRTLDVLGGYELWAPHYDSTVDGQLDLPLISALTQLNWKDVHCAVDLACGTGRVATWLKSEKGIQNIDGVDCSRPMLDIARAKSVYQKLIEADITASSLPAGEYDLALNVLAACHFSDLAGIYTEAGRLIRPGRYFLLVDVHPSFFARGIPTHLETSTGETVAIRNYVHHFSDHVEAGRNAGLELIELRERLVDDEWVRRSPNLGKYQNQPIGFAMLWASRRQ